MTATRLQQGNFSAEAFNPGPCIVQDSRPENYDTLFDDTYLFRLNKVASPPGQKKVEENVVALIVDLFCLQRANIYMALYCNTTYKRK